MKIHNQTILLTGGVTIFNIELAKRLLEQHNTIILVDSSPDALLAVAQMISGIHIACFDLQNEIDHLPLILYLQKNFPPITAIINCVSTEKYSSLKTQPPLSLAYIQQQLEKSLLHIISFTTSLLPYLQRQPESAIVNISTHTISLPKSYSAVYFIAQKVLSGFSNTLQQQFHHEQSSLHIFNYQATQINPINDQQQPSSGHISASHLATKILWAWQHKHYEQSWGRIAHTINCMQWMISSLRKSVHLPYTNNTKGKV